MAKGLTLAAWAAMAAACTGGVGDGGTDQPIESEDGEGGHAGGEAIEGPIPPTAKACSGDAASAGPGSWRRLTSRQYKNTIKDLLDIDVDVALFLGDTTTGRFATNAGAATPDAQILKYQDTAGKLAAAAVADLSALTGCAPGRDEDACAAMFFNDFGRRAWRRPLTDKDRALLKAVYDVGKQESFSNGIRLVVEAVLQSPSFLYVVEYGIDSSGGVARLDAYELASRLSYTLLDTMPDEELFEAARTGALDEPKGIRDQAQRLTSSANFLETLSSFHEQLFGIDQLSKPGGVVRDAKRYPEWSDSLMAAMRDETRQFVASVFIDGEGSLQELLSAPYGFPTGPLLELYGAEVGAKGKVMFMDGSRKGILTQSATLSSAVPTDSLFRAVLRGKLLRTEIFCEPLPPVPGNVEFKQPPGAEDMTQQELLRVHQEDPGCRACHQHMDPLGFALESYDGIGRHRDQTEDGERVDTSGTIVGTDVEGPFSDTAGFIEKIASSRDVRSCFAKQWFRFALARDPTTADACSLAKTRDALIEAGGDLREALMLLVTSDSFRYRGGL